MQVASVLVQRLLFQYQTAVHRQQLHLILLLEYRQALQALLGQPALQGLQELQELRGLKVHKAHKVRLALALVTYWPQTTLVTLLMLAPLGQTSASEL